jgi:aminopeptidase N
LAALVEKGDPSYLVEAEAYRSLGKTRQKSAYETIAKGLQRDSHDDSIRQGVFDGLRELRDERAVDLALEWTAYGHPMRARGAAVHALGELGEKDKRVDDALAALLDDQRIASFMVRRAAVGALRERGKPEDVSVLERAAERDSDERVRRGAREAVRRIREGKDKDEALKDLRDRLDKLSDENRALRDRLDKLEAR